MNQPAPSQSPETQALRDAYAALNRNDIPGFLAILDPQIHRMEFPGSPHTATFHGLPAFKAHVEKARASWAQGTCEPQKFIVAGDKIIIYVHVHVKLKSETDWRKGDVFDAFAFRNGKAVEFHSFATEKEALDWASIKAPAAR